MKILIAEDDPQLGDALQSGLRLQGFQVNWVRDGFAALHELRQSDYAIVVLDISMPRISGLEVLQQMRSEKLSTSFGFDGARCQSRNCHSFGCGSGRLCG